MLIDTHVHLNDPKFREHLDEVIIAAENNGVSKMIVSGYDYKSSIEAIEIAHRYPNIYASVGLHPSEVSKIDEDDLSWIYKLTEDSKVVAIGEIGLDYYWDKTFKEKQIKYFQKQLEIAEKLKFPVVVHSRSAAQDTYDTLEKYKVIGVMHCYAYSTEMAYRFIKLGYVLGIGGVVTFKNASLKEVVKAIDLEHIVTETDAPYLAPTPYRGKTNEPKYMKYIVSEIARLKEKSEEEVIYKISENVKRIFKI